MICLSMQEMKSMDFQWEADSTLSRRRAGRHKVAQKFP